MHNQYNTDMEDNTKKRLVWVDLLRLVAIFMVIAIHCADPFNVSPEARSNPDYNFWGSFYGSMLRSCVPLFVMITGLLLLPVKTDTSIFYSKRLLRVLVPFLVWSVIYNLYPWITGLLGLPQSSISNVFAYAPADASQSFADAMRNIAMIPINFNTYTVPMWYLYMLIGLYLYMPFFSSWVEKSTRKEQRIFIMLWAISLFIPFARYYIGSDLHGVCAWNAFDTLYYFAGFNGYLLLGYYLSKSKVEYSLLKTFAPCLLLFAVGYLTTYFGFRSITSNPTCSEQDMEMFFLYCSPNVALMTVAVFMFIRSIKITNKKITALLSNLTKCGLGIYLLHYFMVGVGYSFADALSIPVSIRIPITAVIVLLMTWGIVALTYRLFPKLSKWIFG